jgi:pyrimidine deaminase RibD-like protein
MMALEHLSPHERRCMERAIALARRCTPESADKVSPAVAALVMAPDGSILGDAYRGEDEPGEHAEYILLDKKLKDQTLAGTTLFVTLEPCTIRNFPKTPCAERVEKRHFARVFIGMLDPNRTIQGFGYWALRRAGVDVQLFPKEFADQLDEVNRHFIDHHQSSHSAQAAEGAAVPSSVDLVGTQVARLAEIRADGTRLRDPDYQGHFERDFQKWSSVTKEDVAELTDVEEATEFAQAGIGARNPGGMIDARAGLKAQLEYLRDRVWPKLREGYWNSSTFCQQQLELAKRAGDGDVEEFIVDAWRLGYKLRCEIRSTQPPLIDVVGQWVVQTDQGFRDRGVTTLADRFRRGDGLGDDEIAAPGDWKDQSAYVERRLAALVALVGARRSERAHPSSTALETTSVLDGVASVSHRAQIRRLLEQAAARVHTGLEVDWGDTAAGLSIDHRIGIAHHRGLVDQLDEWTQLARGREEASRALQARFASELEAMRLEPRFAIDVIARGFAARTEDRARRNLLEQRLDWSELWQVWGPVSSGPADGARFRELEFGLAIAMDGISPDDYEAKALEFIQIIQPMFDAAESWPEAREFAAAYHAYASFDRAAVENEVLEANARETVGVAIGCPVCGPDSSPWAVSEQAILRR